MDEDLGNKPTNNKTDSRKQDHRDEIGYANENQPNNRTAYSSRHPQWNRGELHRNEANQRSNNHRDQHQRGTISRTQKAVSKSKKHTSCGVLLFAQLFCVLLQQKGRKHWRERQGIEG